ncbi:hypothetical protein K8P10_000681 [Leucobacter sp. Psy1]|nr:hypothetical protein K8P10_000681 [Leucobacter sp. Psy1]
MSYSVVGSLALRRDTFETQVNTVTITQPREGFPWHPTGFPLFLSVFISPSSHSAHRPVRAA